MVPAQLSAEIDPESKLHFTRKVMPGKGNIIYLEKSDRKGLRCMSNFEDTMFEMEALLNEHTKAPECAELMEVDVIEFTSTSDVKVAEAEDPDATDYSSSFAATASGTGTCSGLSDTEVDSGFCGENGLGLNGYDHLFPTRKKKLTSHWRSFIRPLMWRCKWTELRVKEFESQASKYATELAAYNQRKQLELDQFTLESFGSKSSPVTFQNHRRKVMKRRKRKRVEDTTDITSYMSRHNLFSYHENESLDPECTAMANFVYPVFTEQNMTGHDEFGINDDLSLNETKDSDKYLEQILGKIEITHSRVHKMKAQLDMVMINNATKFSSSENLSLLVPSDAQTSSAAHSPTFSACNGDTISLSAIHPSSQHVDYNIGDLFMHETAVSSYGEAIPVPDIIESTVGLLSSADVTLHQPQNGDSFEDIVDNLLIHNQAAEAERHTFKRIGTPLIEKHQEPEKSGQEEAINPSSITAQELHSLAKTYTAPEQSTRKSYLASGVHFPQNKRKRGERRAGSSSWSQKCSSKPESQ